MCMAATISTRMCGYLTLRWRVARWSRSSSCIVTLRMGSEALTGCNGFRLHDDIHPLTRALVVSHGIAGLTFITLLLPVV